MLGKNLILLACIFLASFDAYAKSIVFDLDGVVLFHAPENSDPLKTIMVESDTTRGGDVAASATRYRVADGFCELLLYLEKQGWKVHIFSFGNKTRNESAAKAIQLPDGRSAWDLIQSSGGKVFSNTDGLNLDPNDKRTVIDTRLPREERPQIVKSLEKVLGKEEAKDAFLVEDMLSNAAPGKERNQQTIFLPYRWVYNENGIEVKFVEDNSPSVRSALVAENIPKAQETIQRFRSLRDRMAYLAGLIDTLEERAVKHGKSMHEILEEMQWQKDPKQNFIETNGQRQFKPALLESSIVDRGMATLTEGINPGLKKAPSFEAEKLCARAMSKLSRLLTVTEPSVAFQF